MTISVLLAASGASAATADGAAAWRLHPAPGSEDGASEEPVLLAQAYDFDVYIDEHGREIIVDPYTGEVVEIRPPAHVQRRQRSARGLDQDQIYDFTNPREIQRFLRERLRVYPDPSYREDHRDYGEVYEDPSYPAPEETYPEAPSQSFETIPAPDRAVRRAPLDPPADSPPPVDEGEVASAPESQARGGLEPGTPERSGASLPPDSAIIAPGARGASEAVAEYQVLLDRAGASPGVIDGRMGDNVNKAIDAYHKITGKRLKTYDKEWIKAELEATGGPALIEYTITPEDAAGPYVASVPEDYGEKARLERLSYTSVAEKLAEKFHMDEKYLMALNPQANFNRPGTVIKVANPGEPIEADVARIVADKSAKQVRAYDEGGRLLAAYPATIGSADTPSPTGTHEVARVAFDPEYTYNPKVNFKQGNNDEVLTIPPGPNGPVGSIWIALSKPSYGIHGTPEPAKIGKTYSHGCVRLTNWDATELAKRVKKGVTVEFAE